MWNPIPLLVVHEVAQGAEQWRVVACDAAGTHLCSKVFGTAELACEEQRGLADALRNLDERMTMLVLKKWMDDPRPWRESARTAASRTLRGE